MNWLFDMPGIGTVYCDAGCDLMSRLEGYEIRSFKSNSLTAKKVILVKIHRQVFDLSNKNI